MEKSRKRGAAEAIALVFWTLLSGGTGIVAERYRADGELTAAAAVLSVAKDEAKASKAALAAAQGGYEAAKWRLIESEQRERELKRQLELALAAQGGNEELVKAIKRLTDKIKVAPAKAQRPVEKPQVNAPAVPVPVPEPAPAKPAPAAPGKIEPQAVAGGVDPAEMVAAHNRWRDEVGVPGLKWSDKLADVAQVWADHLAGNNCAMYHSGNGYGENIYQVSALMWPDGKREFRAVPSGRPVDAWGEEKQWYNAETGQCSATGKDTCGHYTQVIWGDTTEVGCAMAACGNNSQVWVCSYSPAGNVVGQKPF